MEHLSREQLLDLLRRAKEKSERDWLLLLVTFWHGLRASEAVNLTPAHFRDGYITIQRLKGSLRTTQPLVADADPLLDEKNALAHWMEKNCAGNSERLFSVSRHAFYRIMRRHGRAAGLPAHLCHPHVLKHSIAMQTIREAGIENVRQYLGHVSIASTGEYLKVDDEAASSAITSAARKRGARPAQNMELRASRPRKTPRSSRG